MHFKCSSGVFMVAVTHVFPLGVHKFLLLGHLNTELI